MDAIFFARTDNIVAAIHPGDANRMVDSCTAAESEVTLTMYQADAIVSGPVGYNTCFVRTSRHTCRLDLNTVDTIAAGYLRRTSQFEHSPLLGSSWTKRKASPIGEANISQYSLNRCVCFD
jgi:hypothetical protein